MNQLTVKASNPRTAIRAALKGATPVSAKIIEPGGTGAYDFRREDAIEVTWSNGATTLHHDKFCGQDSLEGGMYRPYVTLTNVIWHDKNFNDVAECRLWAFGPREQKRFEEAIALAYPGEGAD